MWLASCYPKISANLAAISVAVPSETAPIEPAGLDHCNPSQISKALESVLYRVIPSTAYAVGLSDVGPTGGTNAFVPSNFTYPVPVCLNVEIESLTKFVITLSRTA